MGRDSLEKRIESIKLQILVVTRNPPLLSLLPISCCIPTSTSNVINDVLLDKHSRRNDIEEYHYRLYLFARTLGQVSMIVVIASMFLILKSLESPCMHEIINGFDKFILKSISSSPFTNSSCIALENTVITQQSTLI